MLKLKCLELNSAHSIGNKFLKPNLVLWLIPEHLHLPYTSPIIWSPLDIHLYFIPFYSLSTLKFCAYLDWSLYHSWMTSCGALQTAERLTGFCPDTIWPQKNYLTWLDIYFFICATWNRSSLTIEWVRISLGTNTTLLAGPVWSMVFLKVGRPHFGSKMNTMSVVWVEGWVCKLRVVHTPAVFLLGVWPWTNY